MAGRARLSGVARRLLALLAAVVLLHALVLQWLGRELDAPPRLRPLAAPMFTRLLRPDPAVVPPPPVAPVKPRPASRRVAVSTIPRKPAVPAAPAPAASSAAALPAASDTVAQAEPAPPETPPLPDSAPDAAAAASAPSSAPVETAPASAPVAAQPASAAATAATTTGPDSWPGDTRLNYRLSGYVRGEIHGSARVQWQRQDSAYQARVEIDLTLVSVTLTSQGEVTAQGLAPRAYEETQPNRTRGVRLGEDTVVLHDGRNVPRPAGVQDTASQFVELSHRFATGQDRLEVGRSVSFWMARPGAVDLWTYDIVEREILQTGELGPVEAFHLKPQPIANPRGNITAEIWFAPSLQYLPVRIRVKMGEDAYLDLMVRNIEQR